jgi:hypothetical protein
MSEVLVRVDNSAVATHNEKRTVSCRNNETIRSTDFLPKTLVNPSTQSPPAAVVTEREAQDCENTESQLAHTTMHSTMEMVGNTNRPFVRSVFAWALRRPKADTGCSCWRFGATHLQQLFLSATMRTFFFSL